MENQPTLIRKYGRYDFSRFDKSSSSSASAGSEVIGKVLIDCQFLFRQSQWGVLGKQEFPAGVIYLNLNLGPPQGSSVKSVTITVTLDSEDPSLKPYGVDRILHPDDIPVQITDWYGPKQMFGSKTEVETKRRTKLAPEVNVLGNGGGGVGFESEKSFTYASRWSFNGQLLPSEKDCQWWYTTLKWEIQENELKSQRSRSNRICTAFAFEHSGQPFLMKVKIEGKLEKWTYRIKEKLKFGAGKNKKGETTNTLIDFGEYRRFRKRLDGIAQGLSRAMEMKNLEEVSIEVPEPSIPRFEAVASGGAGDLTMDQTAINLQAQSSARAEVPVSDPIRQQTLEVVDPTLPTAADLMLLLNAQRGPAAETAFGTENGDSSQNVETSLNQECDEPSQGAETTLADPSELSKSAESVQIDESNGDVEENGSEKSWKINAEGVGQDAEGTVEVVEDADEEMSDETWQRTTVISREYETPPVAERSRHKDLAVVRDLVEKLAEIPVILAVLQLLLWLMDVLASVLRIWSNISLRGAEAYTSKGRAQETKRVVVSDSKQSPKDERRKVGSKIPKRTVA